VLASEADICPYLAAADVMVTDHSSAGFEYLLLDRPLVRIHVPALITLANIHRDYVRMLSDVSESTTDVDDTVAAVERALAAPAARSAIRRDVAADLFHDPGTATQRCVEALHEAIGLSAERETLNVEPRTANGERRLSAAPPEPACRP
jgi:CDP-glycerol glycerophosphotransferase (TagB/SpsB family)